MTHGFERTLPWAVAALAIVVWLVPLQLGVWGNHVITDIPVYQEAWQHMADGQVPYRDFTLEYPPFAAGLFWLAGTIPGIYAAVFSGLMLACLIATAVAAVAIARVLGMPPWPGCRGGGRRAEPADCSGPWCRRGTTSRSPPPWRGCCGRR